MEDWAASIEDQELYYTKSLEFNGTTYKLRIWVEQLKTNRFWIGVSSGKKRKELDIFEDKPNKSMGGMKALIWIKKEVLTFPEFFKTTHYYVGKRQYICIAWADSRRRNIYQRLEKDGFKFQIIDKEKVLIKEV